MSTNEHAEQADAERPDPTAAEGTPAEGESAPAEGETTPAETAPAEGETASAAGETASGPVGDDPASMGPQGSAANPAKAPDRTDPRPISPARHLLLIGITLALIVGIVLFLPRKVDLIVDNGHSTPIQIFVNGEDRGKVERYGSRTLSSIPAGKVTLEAHILGPEGQRGEDLEPATSELSAPLFHKRRRAYVWNVSGKTATYWIMTHGYGDKKDEVFAPEAYVPPGKVFAIPGRCEPLLNEFPEQIRVRGGAKGGTREALFTDRFVREKVEERQRAKSVEGLKPMLDLQKQKQQ